MRRDFVVNVAENGRETTSLFIDYTVVKKQTVLMKIAQMQRKVQE